MKKGLIVILASVLAVAMGLGGLSFVNNVKNTRSFMSDGYILDPSDEEMVTTDVDTQYYFTQGTNYKQKYGNQILFKDTSGNNNAIDTMHFIHYNDGSLGSFTKGVVMDISELDEANYGYYSLTKNTVLIKNGSSYELTSRGESMALSEFVWKISDVDYMLVSPSITLDVGPEEVTFQDYAQITYVDSGIVRISHQTGTYQTVAADSELVTEQGAELNLVGKSFMMDGEPIFSLDDMAIDDNSYIDVDENVDAPTIPTFNVINGKDGASGTDGKEGEQGEEGEAGEEGEEGSEGTAGGEGTMGSEGSIGQDGVEGDSGVMGYDGKLGAMGLDADDGKGTSDIDAANLNPRPTITMKSVGKEGAEYSVTPSTATFTMNMNSDTNKSYAQNSTKMTLYDRETMQVVEQNGKKLEDIDFSQLERSGELTYQFKDLDPDKEYVMVVKGSYVVDQDNPQGSTIETEYYRKVFKTEPVGISLDKIGVTENSISAKANVTGVVKQYSVRFYYINDSGEKVTIDIEKIGDITSSADATTQEFTVRDGVEYTTNDSTGAKANASIKSNSKYYAELVNVYHTATQLVSTDGSVVEFMTLKETPYKTGTGTSESDPKVPMSAIKPDLIASEKNHTMTLSVPALTDPDAGIIGYRYELYKTSELDNPSEMVPSFKHETKAMEDVTFTIPTGDTSSYVGRVVAIFDDNETVRDLTSLMSDPASLSGTDSSLKAYFLESTLKGESDYIEGDFIIEDTNGTSLMNYVNAQKPLTITLTGEYDNIERITISDLNASSSFGTGGKWTAEVVQKDTNSCKLHFKIEGLRNNTTYQLVARGPEDTDGDLDVKANTEEAQTYLNGAKVQTGTYSTLSLASYAAPAPNAAFCFAIAFTNPIEEAAADVNYTISTLNSVQLELYHYDTNNVPMKMGEVATIKDDQILEGHVSDFENIEQPRANVEMESKDIENPSTTLRSLKVKSTPSSTDEKFLLTPRSFGINDNDAAFFSGGYFQIKAVGGDDYTEHKNAIGFKAGEDVINFSVTERHVQAANPNLQVGVIEIPNSGAESGHSEAGLGDDTLVGLRLHADYPYQDVKTVHYYIYEIDDSDPTKIVSTSTIDGATSQDPGTLIYNDFGGTNIPKLNLVMHAYKSDASHVDVDDFTIYFKGNYSPNAGEGGFVIKNSQETVISESTPDLLSRGKRYIVRYEVEPTEEAHAKLDCAGGDVNYPNCAYTAGTAIPYYRSKVIESERQVPYIERYPYSSDNEKDTWKYRFVDPDDAIVVNSEGKTTSIIRKSTDITAFTAETLPTGTTKVFTNTNATLKAGFASENIAVTANNFYTVEIPYKKLIASAEEYIVSKPVLPLAATNVSTAPSGIILKGKSANADTPASDKTSDGLEKAILNEGNYRYKITVQGTDVKKYAAFKVTFKNKADNETVVYDPVYVDYMGELTDHTPYGYLYIDASALESLKGGAASATMEVTVKGYYSTMNNGFGDTYKSEKANTTGYAEGENLFAVKTYRADGSYFYRTLTNGAWGNALNYLDHNITNSIFVPGEADGSVGSPSVGLNITSTAGLVSDTIISQRYASTSLALYDAALTDPTSLRRETAILDETGLRIGTDYFTVEKLALGTSDIGIHSTDTNEIIVGEIMPAIERKSISAGATSAELIMKLSGSAAKESSKIYARIFEGSSATEKQLVMVPEAVDEHSTIQFFDNSDNPVNYTKDAYGGSNIEPVTHEGSDYLISLKLRNLKNNKTQYQVQFFTYDAEGNEKLLYCADNKQTGYKYTFNTLEAVEPIITEPTITYNKYDDKSYSFGMAIPGSDGVHMAVYYEIYEGTGTSGTKVVNETLIRPLGNLNGYFYYSSEAANNNTGSANINPGNGTLRVNTTYTIKLTVKDAAQGIDHASTVIGSSTKTFTTVSGLREPGFHIATSTTDDTVKATITATDIQKSLYNGKYYVQLETKDGTVIGDQQEVTIDVSASKNSSIKEVTLPRGTNTDKEYVVHVIAPVDLDNNNVADATTIDVKESATATAQPKATIGFAGNTSELKISATALENFEDVDTVVITAFDAGTSVGSYTVTPLDKTDNKFTISWPWSSDVTGLEAGKEYEIKLQYQSGSSYRGTYTGIVIVQ